MEEVINADPNCLYPDRALKLLIENNKFIKNEYIPVPLDAAKRSDKIRIVVISDTHSTIDSKKLIMPNADILIHAGDFTKYGKRRELEDFNVFLKSLDKIPYKIVIAGNHETSFDKEQNEFIKSDKSILTDCFYLQDSGVNILGLNIYGSPWQPLHAGNAFQMKRGKDLIEKWSLIPSNTDILITHTPPLGYGDCYNGKRHAGCVDLLNIVNNRVRPKFHVFGHIHNDYGSWTNNRTVFINASICNNLYKPINKPILFDIDLPAEK